MSAFYLASSYSRREELNGYKSELEKAGHKVTSRWLTGVHEFGDLHERYHITEMQRFAIEDVEDILLADILMLFSNPLGHVGRGGHHVETGIAIASRKHIIIVGPKVNVFHYLPNVEHHDSFEDFLKYI